MKSTKANVCPITGDYKARRHAMSRKAWNKLSHAEQESFRNEQFRTNFSVWKRKDEDEDEV